VCRVAYCQLSPAPQAAGQARRFVTEASRRWELDPTIGDLTLAVSELVANVVLHAQTPLTVTLTVGHGTVETAVHDDSPRPPALGPIRTHLLTDLATPPQGPETVEPRHPGLDIGPAAVTTGRGLMIVDALADEWGVTQAASGKDVWFRLPAPTAWPHIRACRCLHDQRPPPAASRIRHIPGPWDHPDS
jgi:anti-sigma regulatory factor (Ser/Thr protein kinase)